MRLKSSVFLNHCLLSFFLQLHTCINIFSPVFLPFTLSNVTPVPYRSLLLPFTLFFETGSVSPSLPPPALLLLLVSPFLAPDM